MNKKKRNTTTKLINLPTKKFLVTFERIPMPMSMKVFAIQDFSTINVEAAVIRANSFDESVKTYRKFYLEKTTKILSISEIP